jgi:hypothetical protein
VQLLRQPFGTILVILLTWTLVTSPLHRHGSAPRGLFSFVVRAEKMSCDLARSRDLAVNPNLGVLPGVLRSTSRLRMAPMKYVVV